MTNIRTIHHIEDEPEEVLWVCSALENRYGLDHPEWLVPDSYDDSDALFPLFRLNIDGTPWTIRHCVYESADAFLERFAATVAKNDIAIVDLMINGADGEFSGFSMYHEAVARLDKMQVWVLTGYPIEGKEIDPTRVIVKPPDMTALITSIFETLSLTPGMCDD
jgi:hypothetical protein